ncbi:MAG: type IV secretion system protein [Holophagales bacterium]|nr:type IV secretion system protein [Holophagales bacterium]
MLPGSRSPSTPREAWPGSSRRVPRRVNPRRTAPARAPGGRFRATCAFRRKSCAGSGSGAETARPGGRRGGRLPLLLAGVLLLLTALPAGAQPIPENQLTDLPLFVDQAINNSLTGSTASQRIWDSGNDMAQAVAVILIIWTGLRIAFSGTFQMWELVKFIFILGWPLFFIQYYYTNIPGVGLTFPRLIAEGGDWISSQFGAGILATAMTTLIELGQQQYEALGTEADKPGLWDTIRSGGRVVIHGLLTTGIITAFVLGMIVVVALALAQVVFAKIAIAILIAIGPIFIPFMIVPKMDFLFWGWFKALIQYSLYNAIAMIMLNIWCTVITRYATSMGNLDVSFQSLALLTGTWMVPVAAVLVCAIASIMKVGDIAGMIVGAGSDGGGIIGGAFMAGRIVAAPARVAAAPLKGGVPA